MKIVNCVAEERAHLQLNICATCDVMEERLTLKRSVLLSHRYKSINIRQNQDKL